jgi:lysozyme family protein
MYDFFAKAAAIILADEGVFSDQPGDPGGATKWGIARNEHPEITDAQWAAWTQADSLAMYRAQYWDNNQCGAMPWPWALAVFDGEVNQGSVVKLAQVSLGLSPDGVVGVVTLAAMASASTELLDLFFAGRAIAYIADKQFPQDGRGWFKRLFNTRSQAAVVPTT